MKIVDYTVAYKDSVGNLEKLVTNMMEEDWQPLGGVAVSLSESDKYRYVIWAQAMVKYE